MAGGALTLYGTTVPMGGAGGVVKIHLPSGIAAQWPTGVEGVTVGGLNVGTYRGVELSCSLIEAELLATKATEAHLECSVSMGHTTLSSAVATQATATGRAGVRAATLTTLCASKQLNPGDCFACIDHWNMAFRFPILLSYSAWSEADAAGAFDSDIARGG